MESGIGDWNPREHGFIVDGFVVLFVYNAKRLDFSVTLQWFRKNPFEKYLVLCFCVQNKTNQLLHFVCSYFLNCVFFQICGFYSGNWNVHNHVASGFTDLNTLLRLYEVTSIIHAMDGGRYQPIGSGSSPQNRQDSLDCPEQVRKFVLYN